MQSALCKSSTNWLFSIAMFDCQRVLNKVVFAPYLRLGKIKWTLVARKGLPFWNLKGNGQRQVFARKVTLDLSAFWLIPKLFVRKDSHMCVGDMNQFLIIFVGEVKFWRVWHVSDLGNGYFALCMAFAAFDHVRLPFCMVVATFWHFNLSLAWYFKRSCGFL